MQTTTNTRDLIVCFVFILCICGNDTEFPVSLCHSIHNSSYCYVNTSATVTMRQAYNACASVGPFAQLPVDISSRDHEQHINVMEELRLETTWISLTQHQLNDWTWVNGEIEATPVQGIKLGLCGYYDNGLRALVKGLCHTQEPTMFLCKFQGTICPRKVSRVNCYIFKDRVLTLHHGSYSWHNSRSICKSLGGDLVSAENLTSLHHVLKVLFIKKNELVGIGLRKIDWHFIDGSGQSFLANQTFFGRQELNEVHDSVLACAVLDVKTKTWIRVLCNLTFNFICKMKGDETGRYIDKQEFKWADTIGIYRMAIALLVISFAIVIAALCFTLRRGAYKSTTEITSGGVTQEHNNAGGSTCLPEMRPTASLNAMDLQSYRHTRRSKRQSYNPFDCPPLPPREIQMCLKNADTPVATNLARNINSSNNARDTTIGLALCGQIKADDSNDLDNVSPSYNRIRLPEEMARTCLEKQNGRSKLQNYKQLDLPSLSPRRIPIDVHKVENSSVTNVKEKYKVEDDENIRCFADRFDFRPDLLKVDNRADTHEHDLCFLQENVFCQSIASISNESITTVMVNNPIYQGYSL